MSPKAMLSGLTGQVAKPWFPLVILVLSLANVFIVFLSGGVTALFVSTCAARGRKGFMVAAVCNALGALLGYWIFGEIVERNRELVASGAGRQRHANLDLARRCHLGEAVRHRSGACWAPVAVGQRTTRTTAKSSSERRP